MRWLNEPHHQDLRCLQIQLFSSLVVKELNDTFHKIHVRPVFKSFHEPLKNMGKIALLVEGAVKWLKKCRCAYTQTVLHSYVLFWIISYLFLICVSYCNCSSCIFPHFLFILHKLIYLVRKFRSTCMFDILWLLI